METFFQVEEQIDKTLGQYKTKHWADAEQVGECACTHSSEGLSNTRDETTGTSVSRKNYFFALVILSL